MEDEMRLRGKIKRQFGTVVRESLEMSERTKVLSLLIVAMLLSLLIGYNLGRADGHRQGEKDRDKLWCGALKESYRNMEGISLCQ